MREIESHKFDQFLDLLHEEKIISDRKKIVVLNNIHLIEVKPQDWKRLASQTHSVGFRWAVIWAKEASKNSIQVTVGLELSGQYLFLRTTIAGEKPEIYSWSVYYPAANRPERHLHDMFGVTFVDHIDARRWTRHQAWSKEQFPLRKNFDELSKPLSVTPPDVDYPCIAIEGTDICEVPVGPVHAGIIEPGHFRFQIAGEDVFSLEERLGYVHKGIEKLAEGKNVEELIYLSGRVSGDSTVSHAWAACQASESAANITVPNRALFIRAIMAERERIANHLGDIGAICNDVGFAFAFYQFGRLRELWQRTNEKIFGHRFMMDCLIFGGVKNDLSNQSIQSMREEIDQLHEEIHELSIILKRNGVLQDRLRTTGILKPDTAEKIGALGYVGRASGINYDVRRDASYPPYDAVKVHVPLLSHGDVAERLKVREREIIVSLKLLEDFLNKLPETEIISSQKAVLKDREGIGIIEGWRGEIITYVSFDSRGFVNRFFPRDPSWLIWPALEHLIQENIVPDFPVCNKSVNGSYSGHDL